MSARNLTTGKTLVIGGARGIGAAMTQTLAYAGAPVLRCLLIGLIALATFWRSLGRSGTVSVAPNFRADPGAPPAGP